jgi:hypothetical protein
MVAPSISAKGVRRSAVLDPGTARPVVGWPLRHRYDVLHQPVRLLTRRGDLNILLSWFMP